ncbi:amino acid transporter [Thozetella sp. PMI_491]|nr:amino acid transporter [Thozetella sp. PMI_491]
MSNTDAEKGGDAKSSSSGHPPLGDLAEGELVLPGHGPTLARNFNLISACTTGITTGNSWAVLGGGIVRARIKLPSYNALVSLFYCFIAASVAELASSIPSSGGVYHWALVTAGPRYGKVCGWFAGWLNGLAWAFAVASNCAMTSNMIVFAYSIYHPDYEPERWHVFLCYLAMSWLCCFTVMFAQRLLPLISRIGSFLIVADFFVTIVVCAIMPSQTGIGYAANEVVWRNWDNLTGYSSDGFVFLAGMLNGAYAVGAIDCVTHIAEEISDSRRNLPKALACQVIMGFVTGFCYLIAIFYAADNLPEIMELGSISPIGNMYLRATGSKAGAVGMLILIILPIFCATIGCYVTSGRTIYALGRDGATPFASKIGSVSARWQSPLYATLACGIFMTCIGAVYVGSLTAFNAFIGSFVVLSTLSYLLAILPHLLSGRRILKPGPFWMGRFGSSVNTVACLYIVVSCVIYCFPYSLPTTAASMNYTSVITCGLAALVGLWWAAHGHNHYRGPQVDLQG